MTKPKVSKDDVVAFRDFCVFVRSIYVHNRTLFAASDLQRELLQNIAPCFFGDLNQLLIEHVILQICKITDPEITMGRTNLTVKFLINNADFTGAPDDFKKLTELSDRMHAFRDTIVPARNRLIGHIDREAACSDVALGAAPQEAWNQFWLDLQDFLYIFDRRYVDSQGQFYLNGIAWLSDADMLIKALKESTYFGILWNDTALARKCADIAGSSRYSDV